MALSVSFFSDDKFLSNENCAARIRCAITLTVAAVFVSMANRG